MSVSKALSYAFPLLCTCTLAIGYAAANQWILVVIVMFLLFVWFLALLKPYPWMASFALIASIGLAVFGIFLQVASFLMIGSGLFALASWDLVHFHHFAQTEAAISGMSRLEYKHFESLALVLVFSFLAIIIGRMVSLQISFGGMVLIVIFAVFCLERIWRYFVNRSPE